MVMTADQRPGPENVIFVGRGENIATLLKSFALSVELGDV